MNSAVTEAEKARLGILDLLILMTSVCIFFAATAQNETWFGLQNKSKWAILLKSETAVLYGLASSGVGICFINWLKTKRGFDHPGYRLWVASGLNALAWLPILSFDLSVGSTNGQANFGLLVYVPLLVLGSVGSVVILLYGFSRERWWWRVMYLSLVAFCLVLSAEMLQFLFGYSSPFPSTFKRPSLYLATTLLIFSVICDYRAGLKRDWIHCAGILVFLLFNVGSILFFQILLWFVPIGELLGR